MNKTLGSALIVAGTTIGAGMLALPLATAKLGFGLSTALLIVFALLAVKAAWMMVDHCIALDGPASLDALGRSAFGPLGRLVVAISMGFLYYSLMAAYVSGSASLLAASTGISQGAAALLASLAVAALVTLSVRVVDISNRLLFSLKMVALTLVVAGLLPGISLHNLQGDSALPLASLPIIYTAFGYHGSIPTLVNYLEKDRKALRQAIAGGTLLPLALYLIWQLVVLGSLDQQALVQTDGALEKLVSALTGGQGGWLSQCIHLFADLALATSFLGVAVGMFDFLAALFNRRFTLAGRGQTALLTFIPPLAIALYFPGAFISALGFAALALAMVALVLPALLSHQQKRHLEGALMLGVALLVTVAQLAG
ncbi:aromatic amino acid transport family protein [Gallaecimonas kandeliae]|uniref:aromatic amino acid transport family protein n=1 Tax=Gallaecimonas kandeliae TaxID=3029055 RepID=UPI0026475CE5|nr:aromatic amino acid transport family protein [Gallaecimonas kandeliae]WKE64288.1 aromatic amino acid transport family protein [Gallaecimonas kandeliae]